MGLDYHSTLYKHYKISVQHHNHRHQAYLLLCQDILEGMTDSKAEIVVVEDRTQAIKRAMQMAKTGDVVLLCGKGHETYQILNTGKIHYDEREIVAGILEGKI